MDHTDSQSLPELRGSAILELLNQSGARRVLQSPAYDMGLAEHLPFPFLGIVGQLEMRFALLLSVINPAVGGVLLIGPRGVGKTTCVRSLSAILPQVPVPIEDDVPLEEQQDEEVPVRYEQVKLIELPLNARLEDVVGGVNERIAVQQKRIRLERGILARADQNLLYIDEVNLLDDQIVDAILDAAAQGHYTVRRGAIAGTFRSRMVLIGSMNPEEGELRPQIMDRFGLRVVVQGMENAAERLEVYQRVKAYREDPLAFISQWNEATAIIREEVGLARELLKETVVSEEALEAGIHLVQEMKIDSNRAEFTLFEAARAHAAADGRDVAEARDIRYVAPLALRQRTSEFMIQFFDHQSEEDNRILNIFDQVTGRQ
jgi:magnesium chelatase subunit I